MSGKPVLNGAESMIHTMVGAGVDTCFANPGTSEMAFVAALDLIEGIRPVLTLDESVATGAADAYGRVLGRPAATLLHTGPGLFNGASNLHNARRARSPVLNIVGDHARDHRGLDTPLTTDIEAIARTCSDMVITASSAPQDTARAIAACGTGQGSGRVTSLILPADIAWSAAAGPADALPVAARLPAPENRVLRAAELLRGSKKAGIVLAGDALRPAALRHAAAIAATCGARIMAANLVACLRVGAGAVAVETIPYAVDAAVAFLAAFDTLILVSANPPAAFFAYPDKPGLLAPAGARQYRLTEAGEDSEATLESLAQTLGADSDAVPRIALDRPDIAQGEITPARLGQSIAALLPDEVLLVDESVSVGAKWPSLLRSAAPHDLLKNMGGSIGFGLPASVGAALAAPDRKVICLEADGSAMYTPQALWSQARERLDVLTVILANRQYAILRNEYRNIGAGEPGPRGMEMLDIGRPVLDWCGLASALGVESGRATTMEEFNTLFTTFRAGGRGPCLIEVVI